MLCGIDLQVRRGEVIALIGRSGSGKSTLLRCVNGLEQFEEGRLEVDGQALRHRDAHAMRALRQRVGMVFQNFNLFPHLSAGRNVALAPELVLGESRREAFERACGLLAKVGLADKVDAMPDQLSGGQSRWPREVARVSRKLNQPSECPPAPRPRTTYGFPRVRMLRSARASW